MMKFPLRMAAPLSAALGLAAPARAQDLAWLGGDVVQVARTAWV